MPHSNNKQYLNNHQCLILITNNTPIATNASFYNKQYLNNQYPNNHQCLVLITNNTSITNTPITTNASFQ